MEINYCDISKNFLTIGIPTYNRASKLQRLLNSLEELQSPWLEEGIVGILISDNCSSDSTKDVVQNHQLAKYIDYSRNKENTGANRNLEKLIHNFESDYLLIICDDDSFLPKNLPKVVEGIWLRKPIFALLNTITSSGASIYGDKTTHTSVREILFEEGVKIIWYIGNFIFDIKIKSIPAPILNPKGNWPGMELFFNLYSLGNGISLPYPLIEMKNSNSCGEIEDFYAIHIIDMLETLRQSYKRGLLENNDYRIIINKAVNISCYGVLFPLVFGKHQEKTKLIIKRLLAHYFEHIDRKNKFFLLIAYRIPNFLVKMLRPLNIFFIYHLYYRFFHLGFLNFFRKNKRRNDFYPFLSKTKFEPTWKFNWKEIED